MNFATLVVACCEYLISGRSFELIVAPALADLEFEDAAGRRGRVANRVAVLRALAGAVRCEMLGNAGVFARLSLLSACYFLFPVAMTIRMFKTWPDFFVAVTLVLAFSMVPVMVCFWPARHTPRLD